MKIQTMLVAAALFGAASAYPSQYTFAADTAVVATEAKEPMALITPTDPAAAKLVKPTKDGQASVASRTHGTTEANIEVTIKPGDAGYPGVVIDAPGGKWDLGAYGRIEVTLLNTSEKPITVTLRVDDDGPWQSNPWNGENLSIKPGETKTGLVRFGYSFGKPGHKLKTDSVTKVQLYTGKTTEEKTFRIIKLVATGTPGEAPPVNPASIRVVPKDGILLGNGVSLDGAKQLSASNGAQATVDGSTLKATFPAGKADSTVTIKPSEGMWDLSRSLQTTVTVRNTGSATVTPRVKLISKTDPGKSTEWIAGEPITAGATGQVVVPYIQQGKTFDFAVKKSDQQFASDAASSVVLSTTGDVAAVRSLVVEQIKADVPPAPDMPEWLGKRPPTTEGEWKLTFEDNFEGNSVDLTKWNIYTSNYWDKRTHFSKDNTIVEDGYAKLRYEKKRGFENDDPSLKETDYACGFLDSYGKFVQRYGYFECRMKLPQAPGLWPAFWTMPDRGEAVGPQWKRAMTEQGGMELDILEHLTKWGPYRYNIAHHWDGYGKNHKANGTSNAYFQPDKEGFVTAGVLWLPGEATYYANGQVIGTWKDERIGSIQSYPIVYMVSGGWDNNALDDKQLPADLIIDYVRIWQRGDLASEVDGFQPASKLAQPGKQNVQ